MGDPRIKNLLIYCVTISQSSHIVNMFFYLASNIIYLHIIIPFHFFINILCGFLYVLIRFTYIIICLVNVYNYDSTEGTFSF